MGTGGKARREAKAAKAVVAKKMGQAAGGVGAGVGGKDGMHVGVARGGGVQKHSGRHKKKLQYVVQKSHSSNSHDGVRTND